MDYDKVVPKLSKSLLQDPHSPKEQEIIFFFICGFGICVEHNGTHPMPKPSPPHWCIDVSPTQMWKGLLTRREAWFKSFLVAYHIFLAQINKEIHWICLNFFFLAQIDKEIHWLFCNYFFGTNRQRNPLTYSIFLCFFCSHLVLCKDLLHPWPSEMDALFFSSHFFLLGWFYKFHFANLKIWYMDEKVHNFPQQTPKRPSFLLYNKHLTTNLWRQKKMP
jgi:hypothetical protein